MIYLFSVLAVWRVSHMLAQESGPWEAIWKIRKAVDNTQLAILMDCVACSSVWLSIPVAYFVGSNWMERTLLWLALSGGAMLIERLFHGMLRRGSQEIR